MTPNDYPDFVEAWTQVSEVYGRSPSDGALNLIFNALKRFDLTAIKQALTAHINDPKHGDFPPKPADVVRFLEGDGDTRALSAWSKVITAIERVGPWQSVAFDDPIIHAVIDDMGGWLELCRVTDKEEPFKRNEFAKRYAGYIGRPMDNYPAKLLGEADAANAGEHAEFVKEPKLIGNPERALEVMQRGGERKQLVHAAETVKLLGIAGGKA